MAAFKRYKKVCDICGKEFIGLQNEKYCNLGCRVKGGRSYIVPNYPVVKPKDEQRHCLDCNEKILGKGKYCNSCKVERWKIANRKKK